ncbi:Peptidase family M23 [Streptomyces sp. WMMB 714]|uniref:murein hydrolase activator EnvC family protein n=1 Tax=Streptomyces sp. WMMB 714 TaxID=1286822 RepID=UPI0008238905|nr:Peptidase family M23 [Streptomyces sp. WMMB 714]
MRTFRGRVNGAGIKGGALRGLALYAVLAATAILIGATMTDASAFAVTGERGNGEGVSSQRSGLSHPSGLLAKRRPASRETAPRGERVWPVAGQGGTARARPEVRRGWEPPPSPWASGHRGVDLAAEQGQRVRSVGNGRVSFAGEVAGRGVLSIELSGTGDPPVRTTYEPVRPSVRKGDKVRAGQVVGTVANGPSHCHRVCLHWGARREKRYLDPLSLLPPSLLRGGPSRLLPFHGTPVPAGRTGVGRRDPPRNAGTVGDRARKPPSQAANIAAASRSVGTGIGGSVLAVALVGTALLARQRLSRPRRSTSLRRPP